MIIDTPLVLSNGIRVSNQIIFNFAMQCIPKVCSLTLTKKKRHKNLKMGLGQIHKQKFKMKPIYTNQPKKMLMQIGPKWCMKKQWGTQFTKYIMDWTWKEFIILLFIIYRVIDNEGLHQSGKKSQNEISIILFCKFITSQGSNSQSGKTIWECWDSLDPTIMRVCLSLKTIFHLILSFIV